MENKNLNSIHKIGKAGKIIALISQILLIIALVASLITGFATLALPNDFIKVNGAGNADITLKNSKIAEKIVDLRDLEEMNFNFNMFGIKAKAKTDVEEVSDDVKVYHIDANADGITGREIKILAVGGAFTSALALALVLIAAVFAKKLAKTLEKCPSPFDESVTKAMKAFGFSLIPWAVLKLFMGNMAGVSIALMVVVVLLIMKIFQYGAELQKESDETL